jgi:hypothetical protein
MAAKRRKKRKNSFVYAPFVHFRGNSVLQSVVHASDHPVTSRTPCLASGQAHFSQPPLCGQSEDDRNQSGKEWGAGRAPRRSGLSRSPNLSVLRRHPLKTAKNLFLSNLLIIHMLWLDGGNILQMGPANANYFKRFCWLESSFQVGMKSAKR